MLSISDNKLVVASTDGEFMPAFRYSIYIYGSNSHAVEESTLRCPIGLPSVTEYFPQLHGTCLCHVCWAKCLKQIAIFSASYIKPCNNGLSNWAAHRLSK